MPAQSESYAIASGEVLSGGRFRLPAWRRALTPLQIALVGTNTLAEVNPESDPAVNPNYPANAPWRGVGSQSNVVTAWNGAVWDEVNKRLCPFGGGHADYAGNEFYAWNGWTDQGAFSRLSNPTGSIGNTGVLNDGQESSGVYFDGQPRSFHTYNNFAVRNGVLWFFGGSPYYAGNGASRPFFWNGSSWTMDADLSAGAAYGGVAYDSVRDVFLVTHGSTHQPKTYSPVSKAVSTKSTWINLSGGYVNPHYNALRDVYVLFGTAIHIYSGDCATASGAATIAGAAPSFTVMTAGVQYDAENDRYLVLNGGTSIYVLTPPAVGQNPKTATWVWSQIDFAGTVTSPASNGTYGRFWFSPSLKCCGVVNATNQKMHVFPLE